MKHTTIIFYIGNSNGHFKLPVSLPSYSNIVAHSYYHITLVFVSHTSAIARNQSNTDDLVL